MAERSQLLGAHQDIVSHSGVGNINCFARRLTCGYTLLFTECSDALGAFLAILKGG